MATVDVLFRAALAAHQTGRLAEAESAYRQVLALAPAHADAAAALGAWANEHW